MSNCKVEKLVDVPNKLVGYGGHTGFDIVKYSGNFLNIDYFVEHAISLHQKTVYYDLRRNNLRCSVTKVTGVFGRN